MPPWSLSSRLLQALVPHLQRYFEVAAADAALLAIDLRRRLLASLLAIVSATLCLLLGIGWIVAIVWNTPWRNPALAAMLLSLAISALLGALRAIRPNRPGQEAFSGLRRKFGADAKLISGLPDTSIGTFPRSIIMRRLLNWTGLGQVSRK